MKIRRGFVSNSSSTSFTCVVCGEEQSGMDISLSDVRMTQCSKGHVFCDEHKLEIEEPEIAEDDETDARYYRRYEADPKCCPICQFRAVAVAEGFSYLLAKLGMTREQLLAEIKETFSSYDAYKKYWSEK